MNILFIHANFPGQFRHLATYLAAVGGHRVVGLGENDQVARQAGSTPGVLLRGYKLSRKAAPPTHHYLRSIENDVLRGQAVLRECLEMKKRGFVPDVICAHAGWGEILFIREVFPKARVIGYFEFYFRTHGADIGFDPEFPVTLDDRCQVHTRNMTHLLSWQACDRGWSPTAWQAGLFPEECRRRISVIHDGIDTRRLRGHAGARFRLPGGKELTRDDEVLTLVNRNMEPYRGFHIFMRALPEIQRRRPHAHTLVIGAENDVSYGNPPANGKTWRQQLLEEVGDRLDLARVHFLGPLPFERYVEVLQVSRAHVYMTYPYILSWSILEAMACECLVIGSNTPPVSEVIRHGENGLLFDFFDQKALAETACDVLADTSRYDTLRRCARQTVTERYELNSICIPQQLDLVRGVSREGVEGRKHSGQGG